MKVIANKRESKEKLMRRKNRMVEKEQSIRMTQKEQLIRMSEKEQLIRMTQKGLIKNQILLPQHFLTLENHSCLGCVQQLEKGQMLNIYKEQQKYTLMFEGLTFRKSKKLNGEGQVETLSPQSSELIQSSLCAVLNNGFGFILFGVQVKGDADEKQAKVNGIKLTNEQKALIVRNIKETIPKLMIPRGYLEPVMKDFSKFIKINFISVKQPGEVQKINGKKFDYQLQIMKIGVDIRSLSKSNILFFFCQKEQYGKKRYYRLYMLIQGKVDEKKNQEEFYSIQQQFYRKKRVPIIDSIFCSQNKVRDQTCEAPVKINKKIVALPATKEQQFQKELSTEFQQGAIRKIKTSKQNKKVFYLFDQKQTNSSINKYKKKINLENQTLHVATLQRNLKLRSSKYLQEAKEILQNLLTSKRIKSFKLGLKQERGSKQYFFCFDEDNQKIVAFAQLQAHKVFVSFTEEYHNIKWVIWDIDIC